MLARIHTSTSHAWFLMHPPFGGEWPSVFYIGIKIGLLVSLGHYGDQVSVYNGGSMEYLAIMHFP